MKLPTIAPTKNPLRPAILSPKNAEIPEMKDAIKVVEKSKSFDVCILNE